MVQVNYQSQRDELEVIFKEVDVPEVVKLDNGIFIEFTSEELSAIVLPNFAHMIGIPIEIVDNAKLNFKSFNNDSLKIMLNEQNVNIKIDLAEIENC